MAERSSFTTIKSWVYIVISLILLAIGAYFFRYFTQGGRVNPLGLQFNTAQIGLENQGNQSAVGSLFDASGVVKKVGPSVALINTRTEEVLYDYFRRPYVTRNEGVGSGVIIEKDGYILTNNHVVANATDIEVTLPGRAPVRAELVGADPQTDLAVIRIRGDNLPVAELGDSRRLQVGQPVVAIGNPYGFDNTVTTGVVSALDRSIPLDQGTWLEGLIQTDASINPGNSGGPLMNAQGQVIGINSAIIQQAQGIGFSIPIHRAIEVVEDLVEHGKVLRLGVFAETLSKEVAQRLEQVLRVEIPVTSGAIVLGVEAKSPGADAGLRAGDVITEINGKKVASRKDLINQVGELGYRDQINLLVYRGGRQLRLKTILQ